MKLPPIRYERAETLQAALEVLAAEPDTVKVLAGGQSLMPLLAMRLAGPEALLDINDVPELREVVSESKGIRVGALVRHQELIQHPVIQARQPLLALAGSAIGHLAIRCRGTIGGSVVHSDPSAELPLAVLTLRGTLSLASQASVREVSAPEFFLSYFMTDIRSDELLTSIHFPDLPHGTGVGFSEVARRPGDFALVSAAAVLIPGPGGVIQEARLTLGGVGQVPWEAEAAASILTGAVPTPALFEEAAASVAASVEPLDDLHASAAYRRHLAAVLSRRVLAQAAEWEESR